MACKELFAAFALIAPAASALASQAADQQSAPQAPETALYCLRMEPITGTRIGTVMCQTREQWYQDEVDLDVAWLTDGVRVIG